MQKQPVWRSSSVPIRQLDSRWVNKDSADRGREHGVYRIGWIIVTVLAIGFGLLIGLLNHDLVNVDLLWFQLHWPLGLSLLFALMIGLLAGISLTWLFTVIPLRLQLRKTRRLATGGNGVSGLIND